MKQERPHAVSGARHIDVPVNLCSLLGGGASRLHLCAAADSSVQPLLLLVVVLALLRTGLEGSMGMGGVWGSVSPRSPFPCQGSRVPCTTCMSSDRHGALPNRM